MGTFSRWCNLLIGFWRSDRIRSPHWRYYVCAPKKSYRPEGHPPSIWLPETGLLIGLTDFQLTRVFGPYRHTLLDA